MAFLFRTLVAIYLFAISDGFPSSTYRVSGGFDSLFQYRRPRYTLPSRTSFQNPSFPGYLVVDNGQSKPESRKAPIHEINIIRQTVVVNKKPKSSATGTVRGQSIKPASGQKGPSSHTLGGMTSDRQMRRTPGDVGQTVSGGVPLPDGVHILPGLNWLSNIAVRNALSRQKSSLPQRSSTKETNTQIKNEPLNRQSLSQSSNFGHQNQSPTNIIIYRQGQQQPIIIRTSGQVTLSNTRTPDGPSNLVISKSLSKTSIHSPKTTTTTLKPGEDPPEMENEALHSVR